MAALALLASCAGTPVDPGVLDRVSVRSDFLDPSVIAWRSDRSEDGTDRWVPGDSLLFGLRLETPDRVQQWLATLTLVQRDPRATLGMKFTVNELEVPVYFKLVEVDVEVADESGQALSRSVASVGDAFLTTGPFAGCALAKELDLKVGVKADLDPRQAEVFAKSVFGIIVLFDLVQANKSLAPILRTVVQPPSLFSVIGSLGVSLSITPQIDRVAESTDAAGRKLYVLPLVIEANGSPALLCKLHLVEPRRPLRLAAGVVGIEAVHPTDAGRRFSLQLLDYRIAR